MAYQARLESVCSRKATVGSNPTLSATSCLLSISTQANHSIIHGLARKNFTTQFFLYILFTGYFFPAGRLVNWQIVNVLPLC